jgi:deoxyhypusine synthase
MTKTRSRFLHDRVEPFSPDPDLSPADILERMERISFQGRNLATALRVWKKMLDEEVLIFLGVAGALSAGGLRVLIAHLLEQRYVDCLISTGANLYHDLHETRGRHHFIGSPHVDDAALHAEQIDRIYDTFVSEDEFIDNDNWIAAFAAELECRPYSSREFLCLLGQRLWSATGQHGILTAACQAKVPVYCPGIADSSIGMALSQARHMRAGTGQVDVISDIVESSNLVLRKPRTACVLLGGGTPKNFINQASVQAAFFSPGVADRHRHARFRRGIRCLAGRGQELGQTCPGRRPGDRALRRDHRVAFPRQRTDRARPAAPAEADRAAV